LRNLEVYRITDKGLKRSQITIKVFKYFSHKQRFYALGKWTGMFIPDPGYGSFPSRNPDSDLDYRYRGQKKRGSWIHICNTMSNSTKLCRGSVSGSSQIRITDRDWHPWQAGRMTKKSSVADPGCWSRIRLFPSRIRSVSIPDPGYASKKLSILTTKQQKKIGFLAIENMIRVVNPGSGCWISTHPGSMVPKGTRSRIRIRNTAKKPVKILVA
jgi:hypothetical protein